MCNICANKGTQGYSGNQTCLGLPFNFYASVNSVILDDKGKRDFGQQSCYLEQATQHCHNARRLGGRLKIEDIIK